MAQGGSITLNDGGLTGRYAQALYAQAEDEHVLDQVVDQMQALGRLIDQSAEFRRLLESPLIDIQQGSAAVRAVLAQQGFADTILRFAGVVAANRRLGQMRNIVSAFAALVADKRGVVTAHVTTAHGLTDVQRAAIQARLIEAGYGQINLAEQVDPSILGGLTIRIGARLFDSSIKSRLQRLHYAMKGAA